MLALPERGLLVCCDIELSLLQPQMTGVLVPQPPCSKPGFGMRLVEACAAGTETNISAAAAPRAVTRIFMGHLLLIRLRLSHFRAMLLGGAFLLAPLWFVVAGR